MTKERKNKKTTITKYPKSIEPSDEEKSELAKLRDLDNTERTLEMIGHDVLGKNDSTVK